MEGTKNQLEKGRRLRRKLSKETTEEVKEKNLNGHQMKNIKSSRLKFRKPPN